MDEPAVYDLPIYKFILDNDILMIPLFLFEGFLLASFCESFLEKRFRISQGFNKAAAAISYLLLRLLGRQWSLENWTANAVGHLIWMLTITFILVFGFYKASVGIAAFLIVSFVAINECSMMIAYTFLQLEMKTLYLWVWFVEREYFLLKDFLTAAEITGIVGIFLHCFLSGSFIYLFLNKVIRNFRDKECEIHRTELLFLLAPGITGLLICLLLRMVMIIMESSEPKLLYDKYPLLVPVVPAIMLLCMLSVCYGVKLFQDLIALNRERNGRIILEKQIKSMQEHNTEIERLYSGIRNIKHDMRNTLSIIMRLSDLNGGEEKGELDAYLKELNQTLDKLELKYRTGNAVADTLLNMKYYEILHEMPECELDAKELIFPGGLVFQSYDYGVILGNALDNAMEACKKLYDQGLKKELFIRLSSFQKGNQFFIEVKNSFDGKVFKRREKEFPETHKADKELHGMGLYHIKSTAEKYYGAVEWSAADKVFTLTVMMQNERRNENEL
ncbi:MAG: GHKL domain-containing protein [Lachnospiraceae bacterium]|nr:GHKL domain-containing protein [Lachnospiraceae bacterium]